MKPTKENEDPNFDDWGSESVRQTVSDTSKSKGKSPTKKSPIKRYRKSAHDMNNEMKDQLAFLREELAMISDIAVVRLLVKQQYDAIQEGKT